MKITIMKLNSEFQASPKLQSMTLPQNMKVNVLSIMYNHALNIVIYSKII